MNPVDLVLSHLADQNPRKRGNGWMARCPAHDDKGPSLSIHIGDDGCALLHCFALCTVEQICGAIGLQVSDLFARPDWRADGQPQRLRRSREADWSAALGVLSREAHIVHIAATEAAGGVSLGPDDMARLVIAIDRIQRAREVLNDH